MPVHDPEPRFLEDAIACVRRQTFSDWQLCLADDGSSDERVRALLERHASEDERIELTRHAPARGISGATNAALDLARGEYIALMDHDDLITDDALQAFAALIREQPGLDMVYCDEDRVSTDGAEHSHTFFKPDWSPDLFRTAMYTCHLGVYRRRLAVELGGFRSEFDGSQDYDFVLRLIERTARIGHIPRVLYSWRIHSLSAASGIEAKPAAAEAARSAIESHLARMGVEGSVELGPHANWYRVHYTADRAARVTLVVPLRTGPESVHDESVLADCARSWEVAAHDRLDVMLAGSHETLAVHARALGDAELGLERACLCAVADDEPGSARLINEGVRETGNELLLLMQEPLLALAGGWIAQLAGMASQSGVAAAGGLVLSSDGRVQGGGVVFGDGWPLPVVYRGGDTLFPVLAANVRALNVAFMLRRETFEELGGLDEQLGDLALVDLCLRAGQCGLRAVLCSDVTFARSMLARPTASDPALMTAFRARWRFLGPDPYYSPSFWQGRGDFSPAAG
ncbi:MAG: hypothetical protein DLM63_02865 [Solirubrobacterales bacterium]|nr:MAG: hypothetical protein DLM63_02865 [Solirubrobacterales bacterium]